MKRYRWGWLALALGCTVPALHAQDKPAGKTPPAPPARKETAPPEAAPAAAPTAPAAKPGRQRIAALPSSERGQMVDRIVAVVNDEVITQFELNDRLDLITQQIKKQGAPLPERDVLQRQVLERLVSDAVQVQLAKQTGLRIDDGQLDQTLQRIARENNMSLVEFRAALEKDGANFTKFRDDIRHEMIISRLREREVDDKITVSDSEIQAQIEKDQALGPVNDEFLVEHILVTVPENATPEQVQERRKRIAEALGKVLKGESFSTVAATYSDAPDALQGASLGWRAPSKLPTVFADAVVKLNKDELSPILRSSNGFHLLRLADRRGNFSGPKVVTQHRVRHILIKVNEAMSESDARKRIALLKERVDNGEDFATLAKASSEDDSKGKGGELGWISPGDTVPEFERTVSALEPGKTAVVQTPLGIHLVQLEERRDTDVSNERQRLAARQGVRQRKADESYQEWLRQLRDSAYVEYRLDEK